ncbi:MAG: LPS export ABC transporter permease LptF [Gammaproteobacteria bacterium]|nr:LPS export ABC transporter permease LptF [Gammaproteobacteria bacterium]
MRIFNRYLMREVLDSMLGVTPILLLIFLSDRFVRYLAEAAAGNMSGAVILDLLALKSLVALVLILPLAFFIATLLALGRMYKDSEMIALMACGAGTATVLKMLLRFTVGLALVVAVLSLVIAPWAAGRSNQIVHQARALSEITSVIPGSFKESRKGEHVLYVESVSADQRGLKNVFIQSRSAETLDIMTANSGTKVTDAATGDQFIVLQGGNRYEGSPGSGNYKIISYEKYSLRIRDADPAPADDDMDAKSTLTLWSATDPGSSAELQWRISMPLSVLVFGMLGALLARTSPREGKYAKLFVAVLIYLIYNNMLGVARAWLNRGLLDPVVGMWWVHVAALLLVAVIFMHQAGFRWSLWQHWSAHKERISPGRATA